MVAKSVHPDSAHMPDTFNKDILRLDAAAETDRVAAIIREQVLGQLRRRGVVVGLSGGIDSSVVAALSVRALGPEKVLGLFMPEHHSADEALSLGRMLADHLGIEALVEDIAPALEGLGCYRRQEDAIRTLVPEYGPGWKCKLVLPSVIETDRLNITRLTVQNPHGETSTVRLSVAAYQQIVAATNYKQRVRKMTEYYHADRLNYAAAGTPNRLEYDQGFFVKGETGWPTSSRSPTSTRRRSTSSRNTWAFPRKSAAGPRPPTRSRCRRPRKSSTSPCPTIAWTSVSTR